MHRIAHISDLHISNVSPPDTTHLQWLGKVLLRDKFKVDVVADKHSDLKLGALKNVLRRLRPDSIVITGDITNYGDSGSYDMAVTIIKELQAVAKAKQVICIPGNHDCLSERVAVLRKRSRTGRVLIWGISLFNQEGALIRERSFDSKLRARIEEGVEFGLFNNYTQAIAGSGWGEPNPSIPIFVDGAWGQIAFFLFNSTNDPGYMANEGSIGPLQYNLLNQFVDDPANDEQLSKCVLIALLHHHPINNPDIDADAVERGYNSMRDGALFMTYMGRRRFHFILHGHQHVPYCWKNHPDLGAHIIAAGSATAGSNLSHGSFNVIDLITPFEAVYRRFDYKRTGYEESRGEQRTLAVRDLDRIRITPDEQPLGAEDLAIRTLFGLRKEGYDEVHQYELLDYDVTVSENESYLGTYRRKGNVVGESQDKGLMFVITGSPRMNYNDMQVTASDGQGRRLLVDVVKNDPTQKVLRVNHCAPLETGSAFDTTLKFRWQASKAEPNNFDGMNLMYFRFPVGCLKYRVNVPWLPVGPRVIAYGMGESDPETDGKPALISEANGTYTYSFEIKNPKPLAYLIWLKEA